MTSIVQQETSERKLFGSRCDRCGYISFPVMMVCPKCGPTYWKEVKPLELPSIGTAITWTKLQVAPKGFQSPLIHCVADFGGVKVLGTVQGTPEIQIGDKMVIVKDPTGRFPFAFSRPLKQAKQT